MKNLILFDDAAFTGLLPLTYTRPVAELRIGILTIREKWERYLGCPASFLTLPYLAAKYPVKTGGMNLFVNSGILPTPALVEEIANLKDEEALTDGITTIAAVGDDDMIEHLVRHEYPAQLKYKQTKQSFIKIQFPYDLFRYNGEALVADFELLRKGRTSAAISNTNRVQGAENIFLEAGAKVECAFLNATSGPIYIGKDAEIMEGAMVRGGLALLDHAELKMGAKIYGPTTIGPYSKVGGEVSNSVIQGYSNKGHDGFLGNSVLGEWCNLGADTNNSNLKNNYGEVKLWRYATASFEPTGLQFCGLIMGDHSKCGINTMFNTGTLVGVCANIFDAGFPPQFVPSFAWGGAKGFQTYRIEQAFEVANRVMSRRKVLFMPVDEQILRDIFELSSRYRTWDTV